MLYSKLMDLSQSAMACAGAAPAADDHSQKRKGQHSSVRDSRRVPAAGGSRSAARP